MTQKQPNEVGFHVEGYVEDELFRIIERIDVRYDHKDKVFAEALLILLIRSKKRAKP